MRTSLPLLLLTAQAFAAEPDYVRFVEDKTNARLETAITSWTTPQGAQVDLVGAVHIADQTYFDALNVRFKGYDAVLYELVGGPIQKREQRKTATDDTSSLSWLTKLHAQMQKSLALSGQLEGIDYHAANFVHADMSLEQFEAAREQKGETFLGLFIKAYTAQLNLGDLSGGRGSPGLIKLLEILCRKDGAPELKRLIGREFDSMEVLMAGMEAGSGTVIVTERNKIALKVMHAQLAAGKKRLAIFYGAAHLPSMEKEFLKLGYIKKSEAWLAAWTIPPPVTIGEHERPASR